MYSTEIRHVKAVQNPSLLSCEPKVFFILLPDHSRVAGSNRIDAMQSKGVDKTCIHGVLVNVEPDSAHEGVWGCRPYWRSSVSAAASSAARSSSISARL